MCYREYVTLRPTQDSTFKYLPAPYQNNVVLLLCNEIMTVSNYAFYVPDMSVRATTFGY